MSAPAVKPILFSGPMVRALLDGRKTQTRRVVKPLTKRHPIVNLKEHGVTPQYGYSGKHDDPASWGYVGAEDGCDMPLASWVSALCPYGKAGDLLWVRETWVSLLAVSPATDEPMKIGPGERLITEPTFWMDGEGRKRWHYDGEVIAYAANSDVEFCDGDGFCGDMADRSDMPRWRPSIHMPRRASRLTLRITDVRVQRLQDIGEVDAMTEGAEQIAVTFRREADGRTRSVPTLGGPYRDGFRILWESINGPESWDANPWVWALTFEVIKANVDQVLRA